MTAVDISGTATATSTAASTTAGQLPPIQQHPAGQSRRVRDELDPAPHHTAADIRVLEILKRIRDSRGVEDDDIDGKINYFEVLTRRGL